MFLQATQYELYLGKNPYHTMKNPHEKKNYSIKKYVYSIRTVHMHNQAKKINTFQRKIIQDAKYLSSSRKKIKYF